MKPNRPGQFKFEQREDLTKRIKGLIREYPKSIGIFKEFIQNADDAGAREVKIFIDWRDHARSSLPTPELQALMGPALMVFNDAVFTSEDLANIQRISQEGKLDQMDKTGRFGLGFNTCYNVTDYPCLVTRDGLHIFDPHRRINPQDAGIGLELIPEIWAEYTALLRLFELAGLTKGQPYFDGTIFRLPLRTEQHASVSKISSDPFRKQDLEEIVAQAYSESAELLLFLKHVVRLSIFEITEDGDSPILIFDANTLNSDEVIRKRDLINEVVSGSHANAIAKIRATSPEQRQVSYAHHFRITCPKGNEEQIWQMVSGLYSDSEEQLLNKAVEMHAHQEKALPWAGAAARIRSDDELKSAPRTNGSTYCFLPLPVQTTFPVHINGYFDLNNARTNLSTKASVGQETWRAEWNELLLRFGVSKAYARLLVELKESIGQINPGAYYGYWPQIPSTPSELIEELPASVYQHLVPEAVIRTEGTPGWARINDLNVVPSGWTSLRDPLRADGWLLSNPPLPSHIRSGFKAVGVSGQAVTPALVRDKLRTEDYTHYLLDKVPREILRNRSWLTLLLKFCLDDKPGAEMEGVQLLLTSNNLLCAFGKYWRWIGSEREREIFPDHSIWFLDSTYAEEAGLAADEHATQFSVYPATAQRIVNQLSSVLPTSDNGDAADWNPEGENVPNSAWLQLVFAYLSDEAHKGSRVKADSLKKLHLLPDQFGRLHAPGTANTPLLLPDNTPAGLISALNKLRIPLINGPAGLEHAVHEFHQAYPDQVRSLTPGNLIDALHIYADTWKTHLQSIDDIAPILTYLASATSIELLRKDKKRREALTALPLFPLITGEFFSPADEDVFLSSDDELPPIAGSYRLLETGRHGAWRDLLEALAVPPLDRPTFILKVLLPAYAGLDPDAQLEALRWLRDNLSRAETQLEDANPGSEKRLRNAVSRAYIVRATDGDLVPPESLYDPTSSVIKDVLGDDVLMPDMEYYAVGKDHWLRFFSDLGMTKTPRPTDLVQYLDDLLQEEKREGLYQVASHLEGLYKHFLNHWDSLATRKVMEKNGVRRELKDALQLRAWLPAERDFAKLGRYPGAKIPEYELYKPQELYPAQQGHLAASQAPLFSHRISKEMREDLGMPSRPSLVTVIAHFDHLLSLWQSGEVADPTRLSRSLGEIYRYFGGFLDDQTALQSIRNHYKDKACLWDHSAQTFYLPNHVFAKSFSFLEPQRVALRVSDQVKDRGYDALGRRETLTIDDFLSVLAELEQKYQGEKLPQPVHKQVLALLQQLNTKDLSSIDFQHVPLLSANGLLVRTVSLYVADAPWFEDKIASPDFAWLHQDVPATIISAADIPFLSQCVDEEITGDLIRVDDPEVDAYCDTVTRLLRSPEFLAGITRLIRDQRGFVRQGDLNWLQDVIVQPVDAISTMLWLQRDGVRLQVGAGDAHYFFAPKRTTLYVVKNKEALLRNFITEALNKELR